MNDAAAQETPTSIAATRRTEPVVLAGIASGDGHPMREQAIRERAYAIWEEEGRPEGNDLDHWQRAESEINSASERQPSPPAGGSNQLPEVNITRSF